MLWGASAGVGPGYTLEAVAVRLAVDIAELRDDELASNHNATKKTVPARKR